MTRLEAFFYACLYAFVILGFAYAMAWFGFRVRSLLKLEWS